MEAKLKHLEMIQIVINRMATNSFLIKSWCVTLVAALFALSSSIGNPSFAILAYIPVLMFWILDSYYLWQERLYRQLYDKVRLLNENDIDFSMNARDFISNTPSWMKTAFSKSIIIFYGALVAVFLITLLIVRI